MAEQTATDEVVIEREFDAPRELVWRAWTEPEHFARWYGPDGFTVRQCTMDLRVGGSLRICMSHDQHGEMWTAGVFDEIDPPTKLVYREHHTDSVGNKLGSMAPGWPEETRVALTFDDVGAGKTRMTMRWAVPAKMAEGGALTGWARAFDKLAAYLAQG